MDQYLMNSGGIEANVLPETPVKTFAAFGLLGPDEVKALAWAMKNDKFYFVVEEASEAVCPKDIQAFQLKQGYYANALDDPEGHFKCFLLCFSGRQGELLRLSMGLFGVSPKNRIRFPIFLGGTILNFLNMPEDIFVGYVYKKKPLVKNKDIKWERLHVIKRHLVKKVLTFYAELDGGYSSAMGWKNRGKASMTRQVCEALPFYVREEEAVAEAEYYFKNDLPPESIQYLRECYERLNPREEKKAPLVQHQLSEEFKQLLSLFIKQLVNTPASFTL